MKVTALPKNANLPFYFPTMFDLHVKGILSRQGPRLNVDLIFEELRPLLQLKEAPPEIEDRLQKMMEQERLHA